MIAFLTLLYQNLVIIFIYSLTCHVEHSDNLSFEFHL